MTITTPGTRRAAASIAAAVALTLTAGFAPVQPADAAQLTGTFRNRLTAESKAASVLASTDASLASTIHTATRTTTTVRRPSAPAVSTIRRTTTTTTNTTASTSTTTDSPAAAPTNETTRAQSILAGYIARYPILSGTTLSFGDAKGYQAICYYKSGRIVISPTHTASLESILGHEVWHVIDWRDNGVIDWGENIPPR
ncbi:MAG: hypothetical protein RBS17_06655 [Coriobacteriia bacterium]|nr:hypothetical protein [Coriobacteriia bacterium]